jgi:NAD-dependent dihydropyrimidine dehydrogenase PreA subunit
MEKLKYHDILYNDEQLGPYPDHLLKRVDKPTNRIPGSVDRVSKRDSPFAKSERGEFGREIQEGIRKMTVRYPLGAALVDLQMHINGYKLAANAVATRQAPIPEDPRVRSRHIKSLGYFLGADLVGVGHLPQSAVYTTDVQGETVEAPYKYAIVFLARKNEQTLSASNGWDDIVDSASFQAYQRLATQTEVTANYLRRLGHDALASNMENYVTLMPQVILEAGLGEVCRMGIILNPFLGANFKAAAVLTNMELEVDGYVDFGLQEFCSKCTICAQQCPVGAISRAGQTLYNGYYTWKLNREACSAFDVTNKEGCVCGRCTKVCPWHRPTMDGRDYAGWDGNLEWLYKTVDEQRERLLANNFVNEDEYAKKWWFRLDEPNSDGEIVLATGKNRQKICRDYPIQE